MTKYVSHSKSVSKGSDLGRPISKIVVARGNPDAQIVIIGEAPGAKEEEIGKPFVGRSGKFLDQLLQNSGFDVRQDVYFCNVIKCRPPKNRRPTKIEIQENLPWLLQQIKLVNPKIVVLVGATASEAILKNKSPISIIRGKWIDWDGRLVMPIFHPAYLLRNQSKEVGSPMSLTKSDFLKIKEKIDTLK